MPCETMLKKNSRGYKLVILCEALLNDISFAAGVSCNDFLHLFDIHLLLWSKVNCKIVKEQIYSNKRNLFCKLHLLREQTTLKSMLNAFMDEMKSNLQWKVLIEQRKFSFKKLCTN